MYPFIVRALQKMFQGTMRKNKKSKTCGVINDPLVKTHSSAVSDHYFLKIVLFWAILKSVDGRTNVRTDDTVENSDHYRLWWCVGRVDQEEQ